jgi:preprotein translocase subunit SecY
VLARGGGIDTTDFSIFALGVTPLITAFLLVEIVAAIAGWIRPGWRAWRHGGAVGRGKLGRATAVVALALALLQSHHIARLLELTPDVLSSFGLESHLLRMASLTAGMMLLAVLATLISRRGIGNGYAVLLVASAAMRVPWASIVDAGAHGAFALGTFALIAIVLAVILGWRVGREGAVQVPLPAGAFPESVAAQA